MAFQPTGQGAKVVVTYENDLGFWSNIYWFYKDPFDVNDLQALATQVKTSLVDNLVDRLALTTSIYSVVATDERTQDGAIRTGVYTGGTGDQTGDILPLNLALVVTLRTDLRGRAYRGRTYLSGYVEAQMTNGVWNTPEAIAAVDALTAMKDDTLALGWVWGVRSGILNGVERPFAIVTEITSLAVRDQKPGTQRSRTQRV